MAKKTTGSIVHRNDADGKSLTKKRHEIAGTITASRKEISAIPSKKKDLLTLGVLKTRHEV